MVIALTLDWTLPQSLDADRMKNLLIALIGVFLTAAVVSAWIVKSIVKRVIFTGLWVGLTIFTFAQRNNLVNCYDKVVANPGKAQTCSVAGFDVQLPSDKLPKLPPLTSLPSNTTATTAAP
jgi:hypothetical protein